MRLLTDESPHRESGLEWWFVQGYFDGPTLGRRYFMASIFRHALATGDHVTENKQNQFNDGASLLLGVFDPQTSHHQTASIVDSGLVQWTVTDGRGLFQSCNVDQDIVNALIREVAVKGPPHPIKCDERSPKFQSAPLRAHWGDFSFEQRDEGFFLQFAEPDTKKVCQLVLKPLSPRLDVMEGEVSRALGGMAYVTYPRSSLSGQCDSEAVTGEAWIDHQWGTLGWLLSPTQRVLGWDWFGINLEDGSDWIIMIHRDAETGKPFVRHGTVWDSLRQCRRTAEIVATPLRYWQSPRTKIKHPVAWRLEIPELAADFCFEPLADDQEFPLFGTGRAVWEGVGNVSGTVNGRPVKGRARGEFQGYGHIFDFDAHLSEFATDIDAEIETFLPREMNETILESYVGPATWIHEPEALSATLTRPVWDLIARKGKRWRPAFGLLMLEVLGKDAERYRTMMCMLSELAHTGSLIVDDIEDASKVRRGGPAIHEAYGVDIALNAANTLYFLPSLLVQNHLHLSDKQKLEIYEIINAVYIRAHCGQSFDIYWSSNINLSNLKKWLGESLAPKILQGYAYKTAAPIAGFAEIAAVIAGTAPEVRKAAAHLGQMFGVAFQVLDDIRNYSTSPHWTKIAGEDLAAGKLTYVLVQASGMLGDTERKILIDLVCDPQLRQSQDAINQGIALVHKSGALRSCKQEAQSWARKAWSEFSLLVPSSEPKMMLELLCERMLELPYDP